MHFQSQPPGRNPCSHTSKGPPAPPPQLTLGGRYYDQPHFTEEETEEQRGEALSWQGMQVASDSRMKLNLSPHLLTTPAPDPADASTPHGPGSWAVPSHTLQTLLMAAYPTGQGAGQWGHSLFLCFSFRRPSSSPWLPCSLALPRQVPGPAEGSVGPRMAEKQQ